MCLVKFRVSAPAVHGLSVFVTGDCTELGRWDPNAAKQLSLQSQSDSSNIWSADVEIASSSSVEYRYFIGCVLRKSVDPSCGEFITTVQKWESGVSPRTLVLTGGSADAGVAVFGLSNGSVDCVDRGWLTGQSEVCIHLHSHAVKLLDPSMVQRRYRMKCVLADVKPKEETSHDTPLNGINDIGRLFAPVHVTVFGNQGSILQPDSGIVVDGINDHVTFRAQTCVVECLAFKFMLCLDKEGVEFSQLPTIGVAFIHLGAVSKADVTTHMIISPEQEIVGMLSVNTVVINPMENFPRELNFLPCRWQAPSRSLNIGHRGMGSSFINGEPNARVRENTLLSFSEAGRHGADMVEFDVMLTRDNIPVIFHDFMACVSLKASDGTETSRIKMPVSDLTLDELNALNAGQCCDANIPASCRTVEQERAFPTLRRCFEAVDPRIGFNVEVKYCMHLHSTGQYEEGIQHVAERNSYIDIILQEIFLHAGDRNIILSCFDPDMCMMMRAKQTRYAVVFLSQGETKRYPTYQDPRAATLSLAVSFALSESLVGVALHTEGLLNDLQLIEQAHSRGLAVFSWGRDNNDIEILKLLRKHLLDGIIYDRLDEFINKMNEEE